MQVHMNCRQGTVSSIQGPVSSIQGTMNFILCNMSFLMGSVCSLQGAMSSINVILNTGKHELCTWHCYIWALHCEFAIENYEIYIPSLYISLFVL